MYCFDSEQASGLIPSRFSKLSHMRWEKNVMSWSWELTRALRVLLRRRTPLPHIWNEEVQK